MFSVGGIMKKRFVLICAASLLANTAANAADWFDSAGQNPFTAECRHSCNEEPA
jgi:hypothetical protein